MVAGLQTFDPERFQDVHQIGAGSNATVFAAWDRDLERPVALKVSMRDTLLDLLGSTRLTQLGIAEGLQQFVDEIDEATRSRYTLLREARLLARLHHPCVIAVLDVGVLDGSLTLVLPYLSGGTLGEGALDRPWPEVLELVLRFGEGLAAIHEAGLLHRDIKPNNVLLDRDGQPCIADLGLACHIDDHEALAEWPGTPAYMSPEALAHEHRDQRDDLYAFCVVAFQLFFGHMPFASPRARAVGQVSRIEGARGLPSGVRSVLARGLAAKAEQRWSDMPTLLAALRRAAKPRSRRLLVTLGAAAAAFVLGLSSASSLVRADACDDVELELASIWNRDVALELGGALGTRLPVHALDDWALRFTNMRAIECERAKRGALPLQPSACAERMRMQFAVTVEVLGRAGPHEPLDSAALIDELPAPERCLDSARAIVPPGSVLALREADVELHALIVADQLELARARLDEFATLARTHGGRHELALTSLRRGELERRAGALELADDALRFAYQQATELMADGIAAGAMLELAAVAAQQGRLEALDAHVLVARALLERVAPERVAELLEIEARGLLRGDAEQQTRAVEQLRAAVERRERLLRRDGGSPHALAQAQLALAHALHVNGEYDAALAQLERSLATDATDLQLQRAGMRERIEILLTLGRIEEARATAVALQRSATNAAKLADELGWLELTYRSLGACWVRAASDEAKSGDLVFDPLASERAEDH